MDISELFFLILFFFIFNEFEEIICVRSWILKMKISVPVQIKFINKYFFIRGECRLFVFYHLKK